MFAKKPCAQTIMPIKVVGAASYEDAAEALLAAASFLRDGHKQGFVSYGKGIYVFVRTNKSSITVERLYKEVDDEPTGT